MVRCLDHHPAFIRQMENWLAANPLPVPTEREKVVLSQDKPVYRALFLRCGDAVIDGGHGMNTTA